MNFLIILVVILVIILLFLVIYSKYFKSYSVPEFHGGIKGHIGLMSFFLFRDRDNRYGIKIGWASMLATKKLASKLMKKEERDGFIKSFKEEYESKIGKGKTSNEILSELVKEYGYKNIYKEICESEPSMTIESFDAMREYNMHADDIQPVCEEIIYYNVLIGFSENDDLSLEGMFWEEFIKNNDTLLNIIRTDMGNTQITFDDIISVTGGGEHKWTESYSYNFKEGVKDKTETYQNKLITRRDHYINVYKAILEQVKGNMAGVRNSYGTRYMWLAAYGLECEPSPGKEPKAKLQPEAIELWCKLADCDIVILPYKQRKNYRNKINLSIRLSPEVYENVTSKNLITLGMLVTGFEKSYNQKEGVTLECPNIWTIDGEEIETRDITNLINSIDSDNYNNIQSTINILEDCIDELMVNDEIIDKVLQYVTNIIDNYGDRSELLDLIGSVYFEVYHKTGDNLNKAFEYYKLASEMLPDTPLIIEHLGQCYICLGEKDKALKKFNESIILFSSAEEYDNVIDVFNEMINTLNINIVDTSIFIDLCNDEFDDFVESYMESKEQRNILKILIELINTLNPQDVWCNLLIAYGRIVLLYDDLKFDIKLSDYIVMGGNYDDIVLWYCVLLDLVICGKLDINDEVIYKILSQMLNYRYGIIYILFIYISKFDDYKDMLEFLGSTGQLFEEFENLDNTMYTLGYEYFTYEHDELVEYMEKLDDTYNTFVDSIINGDDKFYNDIAEIYQKYKGWCNRYV